MTSEKQSIHGSVPLTGVEDTGKVFINETTAPKVVNISVGLKKIEISTSRLSGTERKLVREKL
jgi:hypothetical protein